jgi:acetyl-CoA C-acetyltransferase/acetyl-CoA acyltransferase
LLDCCPFSGGASVVVVVSEDAAEPFDGEPANVTGVGHATDARASTATSPPIQVADSK